MYSGGFPVAFSTIVPDSAIERVLARVLRRRVLEGTVAVDDARRATRRSGSGSRPSGSASAPPAAAGPSPCRRSSRTACRRSRARARPACRAARSASGRAATRVRRPCRRGVATRRREAEARPARGDRSSWGSRRTMFARLCPNPRTGEPRRAAACDTRGRRDTAGTFVPEIARPGACFLAIDVARGAAAALLTGRPAGRAADPPSKEGGAPRLGALTPSRVRAEMLSPDLRRRAGRAGADVDHGAAGLQELRLLLPRDHGVARIGVRIGTDVVGAVLVIGGVAAPLSQTTSAEPSNG